MFSRVAAIILLSLWGALAPVPALTSDNLNRAFGLGTGVIGAIQHQQPQGSNPQKQTRSQQPQAQPPSATAPRAPASPGESTRERVRYAQAALNRLGFDAGSEDGLPGPRTRAAVTAFRSAFNVGSGGDIDDLLIGALQMAVSQQDRLEATSRTEQAATGAPGEVPEVSPGANIANLSTPATQTSDTRGNTVTILGIEIPAPVSIEIPVEWSTVQSFVPAELLTAPAQPLTRDEVLARLIELRSELDSSFSSALAALEPVVRSANPDRANLDLYLAEWLLAPESKERIGDMTANLVLESGLVLTPDAQQLLQWMDAERLGKESFALALLIVTFPMDSPANVQEEGPVEAPPAMLEPGSSERDDARPRIGTSGFEGGATAATDAVSSRDPPEAIGTDGRVGMLPNVNLDSRPGPAVAGMEVSQPVGSQLESGVWARRSAALLAVGERQEAISAALQGLARDSADALPTASEAAHLALYTAHRSRDVRLPRTGFFRVSPDRRRAVTISRMDDGSHLAELWDVAGRELIVALPVDLLTPYDNVLAVFSEDSSLVALPGKQGILSVFVAENGALLAELPALTPLEPGPYSGADPLFNTVRFNSDGTLLLSSGSRSPPEIKVWSVPDFDLIVTLSGSDLAAIGGSGIVPTDMRASFGSDDNICIWLFQIGSDAFQFAFGPVGGSLSFRQIGPMLPDYRGGVAGGSCSRDGRFLAVEHLTSGGSATYIIDLHDESLKHAFRGDAAGTVVFSPDATQIATLAPRSGMRWQFIDMETGEWLEHHPGAPEGFGMYQPILFSEETGNAVGMDIGVYMFYGTDLLWEDLPTGADLISAATATATGAGADLRTDAETVAAPDRDLMQSEYWARTSDDLRLNGRRLEAIAAALKGIPADVDSVTLEQSVLAYDALYRAIRSRHIRLPLEGRRHDGLLLVMDVSSDGSRAVVEARSESGNSIAELWDVEANVVLATLYEGPQLSHFDTAIFSPEAHYLAYGEAEGYFSVYNARTGELIGTVRGMAPVPGVLPQESLFRSLRFNPSSTLLVSTGFHPARLAVWSLPDLNLVLEIDDHVVPRMLDQNFKEVAATFLDDETLCVSIFTQGSDTNYSALALGTISIGDGRFTPFYSVEQPMTELLMPYASPTCSSDGRWAVIRYGDANYVPMMDVIKIETGDLVHAFSQYLNVGAVFAPDASMVAVVTNDGWDYLDPETGDTSRTLPGAPEGYTTEQPLLFDNVSDAARGYDMFHFNRAGLYEIWDDVPTGLNLIAHALEMLPPALRQEVEVERGR